MCNSDDKYRGVGVLKNCLKHMQLMYAQIHFTTPKRYWRHGTVNTSGFAQNNDIITY